ncbi:helix-turn-helix transcriptional regulator [Streptomyces sp. ME02-8801-2C]|uniref:helix-turn-helix domain-containing protein n=1 Tax=unclassified Streptomyces TaxID=2593676 RepID=UPI0029B9AEA6|nr:helix-turn-helix transcriptional regulator [Streptomyces sp. ME02-8801-2C]MDX3457425.1 helix-turn-helix transcriptional regulator [Streptomyces sp. ME02-8801-2C]
MFEKVPALSQREFEVFCLLAEGASNRSISTFLKVTERTVKAHVAQVLAKLDVESRLQAGIVAFAWAVHSGNRTSPLLPSPPCSTPVLHSLGHG